MRPEDRKLGTRTIDMLPAVHSLVSGRQMIAGQRAGMFRRMAEREGHDMEIVEPTGDTTLLGDQEES